MWFLIAFAVLGAQHHLAAGQLLAGKPPQRQQCLGGDSCCTAANPCGLGEGDCDRDDQCSGDLTCGIDNCNRKSMPSFDSTDDCCQRPAEEFTRPGTEGSGQEGGGLTFLKSINTYSLDGAPLPKSINSYSVSKNSYSLSSTECPKMCTKIYMPVCGSDGTTYNNKCELENASCQSGGNVTMVSKGACPTAPPPPPPSCGDPMCGEVCGVGEICEATDYKCIGSPCCLTHR